MTTKAFSASPVDVNVMPHTPGPWRVSERCNYMIDVLHDNNEKGAITKALCRVQARDSWVAEAEANARLIAAAPELLSVLRKIINSVPFGASHHRIQREAIDLMARLL